MLEIENLTVEVAGKEILHNVSLSVKSGYTTVLFGPNGSGKSTLLMTIMGFSGYKVRSGRILLNGEDITHLPVNERAKRGIGMMMQRPPNITGVRLKDLVRVASKGKVDIAKIAEELDMTNFLERDVNVGFSGGEIKRSEILQLTAQNPCLLLLDEPESGVDMVSIEKLGAKVRELLQGPSHCAGWRERSGKAALIITHTGQILDYVEADRGYVMCNGTVACSGNPRELLAEIRKMGYQECIRCKLNQPNLVVENVASEG
ncbi:MAG TPA: ABC transporter ATP-binding protein [Methanomassiliicoccales archaeon]|jgi:Fe-S cluster assembly ATP-binding protein|nr:ABC transporter ATP-binding protein [Euryarchaeota archaeon]HOE52863.1 ABC transporter ATP-binding protein [Methanomassiliicoccales archaeon]HOO04583.1 ABC transporter ATP-binding protein [Methanomassiliicoccales archaeon]HQM67286.1 ABC transporter ATP-binding protein [Methanomassiliicoccales archaeon]